MVSLNHIKIRRLVKVKVKVKVKCPLIVMMMSLESKITTWYGVCSGKICLDFFLQNGESHATVTHMYDFGFLPGGLL